MGVKIGGLFVDFGIVIIVGIGVVNVMVSLGLILVSLGLDIKDMCVGNKCLVQFNVFDLIVFNESLILGCYLIICVDILVVVNMFVVDIGLLGWMDWVEVMKKKQMDLLIKIVMKNIIFLCLQLEGLVLDKGMYVKKGFFVSVKSKVFK